jgi:hypothetical protein
MNDAIAISLIDRMDRLLGHLSEGPRDFWPLREAAERLALSSDALRTRLAKKGIRFARGQKGAAISSNVYREIMLDLLEEEGKRMGKNGN